MHLSQKFCFLFDSFVCLITVNSKLKIATELTRLEKNIQTQFNKTTLSQLMIFYSVPKG